MQADAAPHQPGPLAIDVGSPGLGFPGFAKRGSLHLSYLPTPLWLQLMGRIPACAQPPASWPSAPLPGDRAPAAYLLRLPPLHP